MGSQNYPFVGNAQTFQNDFAINNQNPGMEYGGTEAGALYAEDREVAGIMYRVINATYNKVAQTWLPIDITKPAYALAIDVSGQVSLLSASAGQSPFTWTQSSIISGPGPVYNVRSFGAIGDGVTDDTAAFNKALAAMPAAVTQPAVGGNGPNHSGSFGACLYLPPGTYYLATVPNWRNGKMGLLQAPGAVMTGPGSLYPSQFWLVDPAATTYPNEPAMLYITEPVPSNRTTTAPQNDDVTGIHLEHYNSGRAGIAIDSRGHGDALFIGLDGYSEYGLDIVTYAATGNDPAPVGPMVVLNNSSAQSLTVMDILDYGDGYTIQADLRKTGSGAAISLKHDTSVYAGNVLEVQTQSGSGTFTGEHAIFSHNGAQTLAFQKENPYVVMGPNFVSLGCGSGAPTYSAEGGSLYLRTDGSAGSRLYVNQGVGGTSTSWTAVAGV